ncbi:MAG: hypothetical protein ACYTDY_00170, partial [Planctomycetota bacterium]
MRENRPRTRPYRRLLVAIAAILFLVPAALAEDWETVGELADQCDAARSKIDEIQSLVEAKGKDFSAEASALNDGLTAALRTVATAESPVELAKKRRSLSLRRTLRRAQRLSGRMVANARRRNRVRRLALRIEPKVEEAAEIVTGLTHAYPPPPPDDPPPDDPPPDDPPPDDPPPDDPPSGTIEMWEYEEWSFDNSTWNGNAFDLVATVTFTH